MKGGDINASRDRTGPLGQGPGTGWGLGGCSEVEYTMTGGNVKCFGRGAGRGGRPWGGGRGRCFGGGYGRMFGAQRPTVMTAEQETAMLEEQVTLLEKQTDAVKSRIDELKAQQEKKDSKKKT